MCRWSFQYNPLESYIETNARGESLITVNNASVLSPKLRYNVGDEAITMTRPELLARLAEVGITEPLPSGWALPFLLLFGRSDSTISYMGANIYPIDVEYGLYRDASLAASIESFCLELAEAPSLEARPLVHVQLRATAELGGPFGGRGTVARRARRAPGRVEPRLRRSAARVAGGGRHPRRRPRSRDGAVRRAKGRDQERVRGEA